MVGNDRLFTAGVTDNGTVFRPYDTFAEAMGNVGAGGLIYKAEGSWPIFGPISGNFTISGPPTGGVVLQLN